MKVSTRGRYGLRAMIELAENEGSGAMPIREISKKQNISESYLEQLFVSLRKDGIIKSVRGAHGGYMLNHPADKIVVGDIIRALEGSIAPAECVSEEGCCELTDKCTAHSVWEKVRDSVNNVLDSMTLAELKLEYIEKQDNKNA